ncbi:hypothetical protein [Nocardia sp. NPDC051981]|uniref:hypothetical protein n=1 Tax=Nocardia sp. NPDC051981 TaxID=3155417 RepID=UPI00343397E3
MTLSVGKPWVAVPVAFSMIWIIPAAFLMTFGHRAPVQDSVVPVATEPSSVPACVMFCDQAGLSSAATTSPPNGCVLLCNEPPLPSHGEICLLFDGKQGC